MKETYKSKVYTERPDYADFEAPAKFEAIKSIIAKRLREHPNAICSYSGGSDSDIMVDIIERTREIFDLPPVRYVFFNTGLEMKAIKDHVKATAEKYEIQIDECRPEVNIVRAVRTYGVPFVSKIMSAGLSEWQRKGIPLSIAQEYEEAEDKAAKRQELKERYPKSESVINFLCCCNSAGEPRPNIQLVINSSKYMRDFIAEYPPDFKISAKCCDYCKKHVAHKVQKGYDMIITGERRDEGGMRSVPRKVGDYIWDNDFGKPCGYEVTGFSFGNLNQDDWEDENVFDQVIVYYTNSSGSITGIFAVSEIGKTVFLTQAEAEEALKRLEVAE